MKTTLTNPLKPIFLLLYLLPLNWLGAQELPDDQKN
jgi:hypothetical protein